MIKIDVEELKMVNGGGYDITRPIKEALLSAAIWTWKNMGLPVVEILEKAIAEFGDFLWVQQQVYREVLGEDTPECAPALEAVYE